MSIRFRKSFKLAPGVRLNVGSSGMSWSLGPRGASVSIGKRGTYFNASLPGTGLSARVPLGRGAQRQVRQPAPAPSQPVMVSLTLQVGDDGVLHYLDQQGNPVSPGIIAQARVQQGDAIRALLQGKCDQINANIASLGELHHDTPEPRPAAPFAPVPFDRALPEPPVPVVLGLAERLLPGRRRTAEEEDTRRQATYQQALADHERARNDHAEDNTRARMRYSAAVAGNPAPMQELLEQRLNEIVWPKETSVAIEVTDDGTGLALDVDLPEVEHMPTKRATLAARSWDLSLRDAGETATRKLYMQHVHALGFRIIGEAFAVLPTVRTLIFSAFSQRTDRSSGHINDDYLYSVCVSRDLWRTLRFDSLPQIDPTEAMARFALRRNMSATGIFKPIVPFTLDALPDLAQTA